MKRILLLPFRILSAGTLVACLTYRVMAQVYSQGVYASGVAYYDVSSTILPFSPYEYKMTEIVWQEDTNGFTIVDFARKSEPGDITRHRLKVQNGSEDFFMPLDSGPAREFKSNEDPPVGKGSGNFAAVLLRCSTDRGGRTTTNALPVLQADWICGSLTNEDIFIFGGDDFALIQNLLEHAYGRPDGAIHPSGPTDGDCPSISYTPAKVGVFLNVTRAMHDSTIVSIVGTRRP